MWEWVGEVGCQVGRCDEWVGGWVGLGVVGGWVVHGRVGMVVIVSNVSFFLFFSVFSFSSQRPKH